MQCDSDCHSDDPLYPVRQIPSHHPATTLLRPISIFPSLENIIRCSIPETGFHGAPFEIVHDKIHARIQEFSSGGGVQVNLT